MAAAVPRCPATEGLFGRRRVSPNAVVPSSRPLPLVVVTVTVVVSICSLKTRKLFTKNIKIYVYIYKYKFENAVAANRLPAAHVYTEFHAINRHTTRCRRNDGESVGKIAITYTPAYVISRVSSPHTPKISVFPSAAAAMLAMSTLMMPAATVTTMTNPAPIAIAQPSKFEPKYILSHNPPPPPLTAATVVQQQMSVNKSGTDSLPVCTINAVCLVRRSLLLLIVVTTRFDI